MQCSGIHRSLGVHISKVRSATLDTWLPEHVSFIQYERMVNTKMIEDLKWKNAEMIEQSEHAFHEYPEKLVRKEKKKKVSEPVNKVAPGVGSPSFVDTKEISYLSKNVSPAEKRPVFEVGESPPLSSEGANIQHQIDPSQRPDYPTSLELVATLYFGHRCEDIAEGVRVGDGKTNSWPFLGEEDSVNELIDGFEAELTENRGGCMTHCSGSASSIS